MPPDLNRTLQMNRKRIECMYLPEGASGWSISHLRSTSMGEVNLPCLFGLGEGEGNSEMEHFHSKELHSAIDYIAAISTPSLQMKIPWRGEKANHHRLHPHHFLTSASENDIHKAEAH